MNIPKYAKPTINENTPKIYSPKGLAEANKKKYGTELTNEIVRERDKNLKSMSNKDLDQFIDYKKEQLGYPKKQSLSQRLNNLIGK
jgi:hypothetical protein